MILAQASDGGLFTALWGQLTGAPAYILLIAVISIVAFVLEKLPRVPNWTILPVCVILGPLLYLLLVSPATVPATYPNPRAVLALEGLVLGFVAWLVHAQVISRLMQHFGPSVPLMQSGNTSFLLKPPTNTP